jgi:hypothetical protein
MKALLLILICSISVLADGINKPKPKRKPKPKVHKVEGIKVTPLPKAPKPPEMLTTKYDELLGYPYLRPLQPLNEIPAIKPEVLTTSEVAVYPFDETRRPKLWFLLIGTAAIPFLIPRGDDSPIPTPFAAPPQVVPVDINPTTGPTPGSSPSPSSSPSSSPGPSPGINPTTSEVPEPTSIVLFVSGMAMIFRRRIRAAAHHIRTRS